MHFDFKGNADRYDNKIMLFLLPIIGSVLFFILHYISKKPYLYNYAQTITENNYQAAYKSASNMMYILKLLIMVLFMAIQYVTYSAIKNASDKESIWIVFIPIAAVVITSIVFITKSFKEK